MSVHRIETLRCELQYGSARSTLQATVWHDRLARYLRHEGLRRIEARFDRHDDAGQVWRIDRLELDLGRLTHLQDAQQWSARLDEALDLALHRARQSMPAAASSSKRLHAVDQFVFYLGQGHLPWDLNLPGRRAVADWLQGLAQGHGQRLWQTLLSHPERDHLLARLALVSPHHGLHALIAQRDAPLAAALQGLDDDCLTPLQAHGWISGHQRQRLQQALRSAGLRALWDARGSVLGAGRRWQLLQALRQAFSRHVGPTWAARLSTLSARAPAGGLMQELIALPALGPTLAADEQDAEADLPSRTWEAALQQLRDALSHPRRHDAALAARIATLLRKLGAAHPAALRSRLLQWAGERRQRRLWSLSLTPENLGLLMRAMGPNGATRPAAPQWSDSLRQTALRLQREAPADRRPGLGRLQALLVEACLQRLAEGQRLPDSHSAWQALWQKAWEQWLGEDDVIAEQDTGRADAERGDRSAAAPNSMKERHLQQHAERPVQRPAERSTDRPAQSPSTPPSSLDQSLQSLARQCREGRWAWPQRLRLARLLETDAACQRWLQLFDESRRWQMLRAQFGPAAHGLQRRAGRLQQWLAGLVRDPVALAQEHWRRLCRYLFVQGLSPDDASLRSQYQAQPLASNVYTARTAPKSPTSEPIWVRDAGQVLLAAYAERLFKQQGLIDQGRFIDATARARGVQCLQTLCHGPGPVDEAQTVLSRLLCGVPPADVLPEVDPLPADTVTLLEQLLQAVIAHWKAVGHTSVAGLRECFLQREGRLQRDKTPIDEPPRWHLRVQTRGFDVLLDRLPWSFQTIRLPWMHGALHVEWR